MAVRKPDVIPHAADGLDFDDSPLLLGGDRAVGDDPAPYSNRMQLYAKRDSDGYLDVYAKDEFNRVTRLTYHGASLFTEDATFIVLEQDDDPSIVVGAGQIYSKDVDGTIQLFYLDDDGTSHQITPLSATIHATDVQIFTYTGGAQTWTKPADAKWVAFDVFGGGGGGGSGRRGAAGTVRCGGGGGGSGCRTQVMYRASDLPATLTVTVGVGGAGAAGPAGNDTNGSAATGGGNSSLTSLIPEAFEIRATGGNAGTGGTDAAGGDCPDFTDNFFRATYKGVRGGKAGDEGGNSVNSASATSRTPTAQMVSGAGGYGQGLDVGNTARAGDDGSNGGQATNFAEGGDGGAINTSGTAAGGFLTGRCAGGGGGAGSGTTAVTGGDGSVPGSGGGGGNGHLNGAGNLGGGDGGAGLVIVTTFF